jgi:hypothetical protein
METGKLDCLEIRRHWVEIRQVRRGIAMKTYRYIMEVLPLYPYVLIQNISDVVDPLIGWPGSAPDW